MYILIFTLYDDVHQSVALINQCCTFINNKIYVHI